MLVDDKNTLEANDVAVGLDDDVDEKRGNAADRADMYRMGKVQEMRVCGQHHLNFAQ